LREGARRGRASHREGDARQNSPAMASRSARALHNNSHFAVPNPEKNQLKNA
jgi:hypothetical protein